MTSGLYNGIQGYGKTQISGKGCTCFAFSGGGDRARACRDENACAGLFWRRARTGCFRRAGLFRRACARSA